MSRVAGLTEDGLEASYRNACNGSMFSTRQGSALDEDELDEIPAPATEDCVGLVSRIHHERDLIDPSKDPEAAETCVPDNQDEVDATPVFPTKMMTFPLCWRRLRKFLNQPKKRMQRTFFLEHWRLLLIKVLVVVTSLFGTVCGGFRFFYAASQRESIPASYETVVTVDGPAGS